MNMIQVLWWFVSCAFDYASAKHQIRMDLILLFPGITYSSIYDEHYRMGLKSMFDVYEIGDQYARFGIIEFYSTINRQLEITSNITEINNMLSYFPNRRSRPSIADAVSESINMFNRAQRPNVINITLLVLEYRPYAKGDSFDPDLGLAEYDAGLLRRIGYFIVAYRYDGFRSKLEENERQYLKNLAERKEHFIENYDSSMYYFLRGTVPNVIIKSICSDATPVRACVYNQERTICQSIWDYDTPYYDDCHLVIKDVNTESCKMTECEEECNKRWPWQKTTCVYRRQRDGPNPRPSLIKYCPEYEDCPQTPSTLFRGGPTTSSDPNTTSIPELTHGGLLATHLYAIIALVAAVIVVVLCCIFYICCCRSGKSSSRRLSLGERWSQRRRLSKHRRPINGDDRRSLERQRRMNDSRRRHSPSSKRRPPSLPRHERSMKRQSPALPRDERSPKPRSMERRSPALPRQQPLVNDQPPSLPRQAQSGKSLSDRNKSSSCSINRNH